MKIKFQLILKKPIHPEHYLLSKLWPLIEAENIEEYDLETVKSWLTIDYLTSYDRAPNRKLLGFTLDIPETEECFKVIVNYGSNTTSFARDLQNDTEIVETILKYEDDFLLADIKKYQPEIFKIEMQLREVLNYILAYNLSDKATDKFLDSFEETELANKEMMKNETQRNERFKGYFENELFHIVFTKYGHIQPNKTKKPKLDDLLKKIKEVNSFEAFKEAFNEISFENVEPKHAIFLGEIKSNLTPLETIRNDIMHNRKPLQSNVSSYENAKARLDETIANFWNNERNRLPSSEVITEYLLDTTFNNPSFNFLENDNIEFVDLEFTKKEMWIYEFKMYLFEQINDFIFAMYSQQLNETSFYSLFDTKIASKRNAI